MNSNQNNKVHRLGGLILVIFVVFVPSIFSSTYTLLTGKQLYNPEAIGAINCYGIISDLIIIAILIYVLSRHGSNLKKIGLSLSWKDFPRSVLLAVIVYGAYLIYYYGSYYIYYFLTGHILDASPKNINFLQTEITIWSLLYLLTNCISEELVARAYIISEVEYLTKKRNIAIFLSVLLQTAYHLYQGLYSAGALGFMFLIYSLYYIKWRRITPIILAHLYFDLLALIRYGM